MSLPPFILFVWHGDFKVIVDNLSMEEVNLIEDQIFCEEYFKIKGVV